MKKFSFIVSVFVLVFLMAGCNSGQNDQPDQNDQNVEIPILSEFEGQKVVYGTEVSVEKALLEKDCKDRGGVFNECGSICAPDEDVCAEVCAYTCDLAENEAQEFELYENEEIGFGIEFDERMSIDEVEGNDGDAIVFSLWGPTQEENTEFYDGISFSVTRRDLNRATLKRLVNQEFSELQNVGEITSQIQSVSLDGYEGYEFSGVSVGAEQKRVFFPVGNVAAIELSIMVGDPTDKGYEDLANKMFESFKFLNMPERNISVQTPSSGDRINDRLNIKGEARVFENVVNYRLKDSLGKILTEGFATANAPDIGRYGDFSVNESFLTPNSEEGVLEVFSISAADGSEIDKVVVPVRF